jgi:hypothetical protein
MTTVMPNVDEKIAPYHEENERVNVGSYRISTITAVGSLGTAFRLSGLFDALATVYFDADIDGADVTKHKDDGGAWFSITFLEQVDKKGNVHSRGVRAKEKRTKKKKAMSSKYSDEEEEEEEEELPAANINTADVSTANPKKKKVKKKTKLKDYEQCGFRYFDNQMTIVMRLPVLSRESNDKEKSYAKALGAKMSNINVKVFNNGNVQVTGAKTIEQGRRCIVNLARLVRETAKTIDDEGLLFTDTKSQKDPVRPLKAEEEGKEAVIPRWTDIEADAYRVCLLNSDSKVRWGVHRDRLYEIMTRDFSLMCGFEPCIYPGVKMQYSGNRMTRDAHKGSVKEGACCCGDDNTGGSGSVRCSGKGKGDGEGDCRRITIAVFRSGCVIVTGAHTYEQLDDAYAFLERIFKTYESEIRIDARPVIT